MKKLFLVYLTTALVFALPTKNNNIENIIYDPEIESFTQQLNISLRSAIEDDDEPEDGWFVPQLDGSLKWVTEEEAQLNTRALMMSRAKSKPTTVDFYLYNNDFPDTPEKIDIYNPHALEGTLFNSAYETRIIIHGWKNNYKSDVNTEIREAFFSVGQYNIICVDWSESSDRWNYQYSVTAIPEVGQKVAILIDYLRDEANMRTEDLKVIGHSLGAHVAGYAGKLIQGEPIHTIIGLDTAFPLFKYGKCEERLCSTDAIYVESIHTNGQLLGFIRPIGQTAFYPNGGKTQPGCGIDLTGSCSHSRAYTYYAEAVRKEFLGVQCDDWKDATKKDCPKDGVPTLARFDKNINNYTFDRIFYSPVSKKAPYGFQI